MAGLVELVMAIGLVGVVVPELLSLRRAEVTMALWGVMVVAVSVLVLVTYL